MSEDRLAAIEEKLGRVLALLEKPPEPRTAFSVEEAAEILGKSPYTVREWCRYGRIVATKRGQRRGGVELWSIAAGELARYRDEGLLETDMHRNAG